MKRFLKGLIPAGILLFSFCLNAEEQKETVFMDFRNQKITDIIYSLAKLCGKSVITDETVNGIQTFHFEDRSFEQALYRFAEANSLWVWKKEDIYYVSKVKIEEKDGKIDVSAEETDVSSFLRMLSRKTKTTVMFDSLPQVNVTVRLSEASLEDVLNLVLMKLPGFSLERIGQGYFIGKNTAGGSRRNTDIFNLSCTDGKYSISLQKADFNTVLEALFKREGKEFSILCKNNQNLESIYFKDKSFEEMRSLILEQAGCSFGIDKDIYYIFEVSKKDATKKFRDVKILELKNISTSVFMQMVPSEILGDAVVKTDEKKNLLVIIAGPESLAGIISFVNLIDVKNDKEKVKSTREIKLKYIKSQELIDSISEPVNRNCIFKTWDSSRVFFTGSDDEYSLFLNQLAFLDIPKQQIKYQILVVQRQKTEGTKFNSSFAINDTQEEPVKNRGLTISNIFNIKFDVISHMGIQFAENLNAELSEGKSRVLADTTLNGLSGEQINFSNTNTYRYRDIIVDTTGDLYTSTTREISSGLTISLNGWVSGDDMITVKIDAQVSKQGSSDSAGDTSNPPATSEKKVSTNVRTRSGESVIIGGLFQQETDVSERRVPVLGSIPLIGNIFRHKTTSTADTEFVIYLVPFVEKKEKSNEERIKRYYEKYVKNPEIEKSRKGDEV